MKKVVTQSITAWLASTLMVAPFIVGQIWFWKPSWFIVLGYAIIGWLPLWLVLRLPQPPETSDDEAEHTDDTPNIVYSRAVAISGLFWTILLLSWHTAPARSTGAKVLGAQRWRTPLETCINDADPHVPVACCEALSSMGPSTQQANYARWLVHHPKLANQCMVRTINGNSSTANELIKIATQKWSHQLMQTPQTSNKNEQDQICQMASYMRHLDRVPGAYTSAHLLMCSSSAQSDVARQCCDQQLKLLAGTTQQSALPNPKVVAQTPFQRHGPTLLNDLLPSLDPKVEANRKRRLGSMTFPYAISQQWALLLACHSIQTASPRLRTQLMTRVSIGMEASGCGTNDDQVTFLRFVDACQIQDQLTHLPEDPAKHLCTTIKLDAMNAATLQTKRLVNQAREVAHAPFWKPKDSLMRAILNYDQNHMRKFESERRNQFIRALRVGPDGLPKKIGEKKENTMMRNAIKHAIKKN